MGYIEKYYLENLNQGNSQIDFDAFGPQGPGGTNVLMRDDSSGGGGITPNKDLTLDEDKDISTTLGNNLATADEYTINITTRFPNANEVGATVYLNDIPLPSLTPKNYKVKLSTLFNSGPQTIEVRKSGYSSNQKYILEVVGSGENNIEDVTLLEDSVSQKILGVNKLELDIRYFEDNVETPFVFQPKGNLTTIPFTLTKEPKVQAPNNTNSVSITLSGPDSSVEIQSGDETDLLDSGEETFVEKTGTKYLIKSPNTTLYRISEVIVTDIDGNSERLTAGNSESISMELVLNRDLTVTILSHRVVKTKVLKPLIKLKSPSTKKYNINEKTDIPLIVEKNDDVRAISMIIGSEILEFDNLKKGKYAGIKIPHRLIESIGKYKIKLFPYSISELQKGQKEENVKELPPPPKPIPNPNIVKETPVLIDTQKETDISVPPVDKGNYSLPPLPIQRDNNRGGDSFDRIGGRS